MIDLYQEAQQVVLALNRTGVAYALCGGLAVGVHGHVRATEDIDVVLASEGDLPVVDAALAPLGWTAHSAALDFANGFQLHRRLHLTPAGTAQLDLLLPPPEADVLSDRIRSDLDGAACWIASRRALRLMKANTDRPRDRDDLLHLEDEA